jgi:hypothetical protein
MSEQGVNFADLIAAMDDAPRYGKVGSNRLTILGGEFAAGRLGDFLQAWTKQLPGMPWRVWEHISDIAIGESIAPGRLALLQRGEAFGEGGHLSLRRDGQRWRWRYIGPANQPALEGFEREPECVDFWAAATAADTVLRRYEERVLLWGQKITDAHRQPKGPLWWEDRVATAHLDYPETLKAYRRVYLAFSRFTEDGRTAFVWYRGLVGDGGAEAKEETHD